MEQKNISPIHRTGILITLLAAAFMTAMSTTVTGNMIPNFIEYFGVSSTLAQWLTSGATLISGIMIPITAFLIKRTANKKYFLILHIKSGGLMLIGIILLISFCVLQMKSDKPMLNLRVFKYSSFRIAVLLSLCMYLICMGNAMILPIFTKSICGYSDTAYGLATVVGSVLSAVAGICSGRIFDKMGAKPMFIGGIILFAAFSVMGTFFTKNTGIVYIAAAFAFQSIAMSMMNSPATTMALSNLSGKERIDGSAIFNTLRQISSSLASTTAVLIYSLIGINGSEMSAIHGAYIYFGIVTLAVIVLVCVYIQSEKRRVSYV